MTPSAIGERVQWQARAIPSGPIGFAIPRRSGGLASMSMSAPVTVAPRYKPPSFSTGALCRPASSAISPSPPSQRRKRKLCDFQSRFVCFGIRVMLDASANVIAFLPRLDNRLETIDVTSSCEPPRSDAVLTRDRRLAPDAPKLSTGGSATSWSRH
jgi:hypothetical protein